MYYSISEALITYISEYKHLLSYLLPEYIMEIEIHDGRPDTNNMDFIIIKLHSTMRDFSIKRTIYDIERLYYDGLELESEIKRKAYLDVNEVKEDYYE